MDTACVKNPNRNYCSVFITLPPNVRMHTRHGKAHCIPAGAISYRTGFYIHLRIDSIQILIFKSLDNARDL